MSIKNKYKFDQDCLEQMDDRYLITHLNEESCLLVSNKSWLAWKIEFLPEGQYDPLLEST